MTFDELFAQYKALIDWIDRRMKPEVLEFHHESVDNWKYAKHTVFLMFERLRYYTEEGIPNLYECLTREGIEDYPPKMYDNYKCPVIGLLNYRDEVFPVYDDDYGQQVFIIVNGQEITVDSLGGETDWYYELDRIIDNIDCKFA